MARESLRQAISKGNSAAVRDWIRQFLMKPRKSDADPLFAEIIAESARNDRIASIFVRMNEDVRENILAALAFLAPGDHLHARRSLLADLILTQSLGLMQQRLLRSMIDTDRLATMVMALVERDIEEMRASSVDQQRPLPIRFASLLTPARTSVRPSRTPSQVSFSGESEILR